MPRIFMAAASCALLATAGAAETPPPRVAGDEAAGTRDCLAMSAITTRRAEGPDSLYFETLGGGAYVNRLAGRCPGLQQASRGFGALAFEVHGGQLCRGDRVRVVESSAGAARGLQNSIPCPLGDFVPVPGEGRR